MLALHFAKISNAITKDEQHKAILDLCLNVLVDSFLQKEIYELQLKQKNNTPIDIYNNSDMD